MNSNIKSIVLSAMFVAMGIVLPLLTGQIKEIGNMLLPMHTPVMLAGLICGPWYGLAVGAVTPILRSLQFGMPVMYPTAIGMAFELATYGLVIGLCYKKFHWHCIKALYKSLVISMISGRLVWGLVTFCLLGAEGFTFKMFMASAFFNAIPGIILQLVIIPVIMVKLKKAKVIKWKEKSNRS